MFLVNNMKFLGTPVLNHISEPLTSAFFKFETVGKKTPFYKQSDRNSLTNMKMLLFERCMRLQKEITEMCHQTCTTDMRGATHIGC